MRSDENFREKIIEKIKASGDNVKIPESIDKAEHISTNQYIILSGLLDLLGPAKLNRGGIVDLLMKDEPGETHLKVFDMLLEKEGQTNGLLIIDPLIDLLKTDRITGLQVEVIETILNNISAVNEIDENVAVCWVIMNSGISKNHAKTLKYIASHGSDRNNVREMRAIINLIRSPVVTDIQMDVLLTIFNHVRFNHDFDEDWTFEHVLRYPHIEENHASLLKKLVNEGKVYNGLNEGAAFFRVLRTNEISDNKREILEKVIENAKYGGLDENFVFAKVLKAGKIDDCKKDALVKIIEASGEDPEFDSNQALRALQ